MPHVDDGALHALLDGALRAESPEDADRAEAHLRSCEDCRARYEAAAATRDAAARILGDIDPDVAPDFDDVLRRATAATPGPGAPPAAAGQGGLARQVRWTRRAAWAASLVIALGTGYLVGERFGGLGPAPDASVSGTRRSLEAATEPEPGPPEDGQASVGPTGGATADRVSEPSRRDRSEPALARPQPAAGEGSDREASEAALAGDIAQEEVAAEAVGEPVTRQDVAVDEAGAARSPQAAPVDALDLDAAAAKSAADGVAHFQALEDSARRPVPGTGQAVALNELVVTGQRRDTTWLEVGLAAARRSVQDSLYVLPRAEPLEAFVRGDGAVRTVQRLSSGVIVEVVQRRAGVDAAAPAAEDRLATPDTAAELVAPSEDEVTAEEDAAPENESTPRLRAAAGPEEAAGPGPARAEAGGFILEVAGPLPLELLQILAGSAKPMPR